MSMQCSHMWPRSLPGSDAFSCIACMCPIMVMQLTRVQKFLGFFSAQVSRSISTQQSMLEGSHSRGVLGSKEQSYWDGSCGQHRGSNLEPQAYKAALLQLRPLPALYPQMFDSTTLVCVCLDTGHSPAPFFCLYPRALCLPGKVLPPPDAVVLRLLYSCL